MCIPGNKPLQTPKKIPINKAIIISNIINCHNILNFIYLVALSNCLRYVLGKPTQKTPILKNKSFSK